MFVCKAAIFIVPNLGSFYCAYLRSIYYAYIITKNFLQYLAASSPLSILIPSLSCLCLVLSLSLIPTFLHLFSDHFQLFTMCSKQQSQEMQHAALHEMTGRPNSSTNVVSTLLDINSIYTNNNSRIILPFLFMERRLGLLHQRLS